MILSIVDPSFKTQKPNGSKNQVLKEHYIRVHHLMLRGTWVFEDVAYFTPLRNK